MLSGRTEACEIMQAARNLGEQPDSLLAACEAVYMNGFADRVGGDVESPTGHFYMVGRWLVVTDDQGFHALHSFVDDRAAEATFDEWESYFVKWDDAEGGC